MSRLEEHRLPDHLPAPAGLIALSLALLPAPAAAQAGYHARIGAQSVATSRGSIARLSVNDRPIATLRVAAGGLTPVQRALSVKSRLTGLVEAGLSSTEIGITPAGGQAWQIRARGLPLLLVTPRDAASEHQAAKTLAGVWARALKSRLADVPLTLSARQVVVPVSETRYVLVGGAARAGDVSLTGQDGRVGAAVYNVHSRRIVLRGVGPGQTQITAAASGVSLPLTVTVARLAAQVEPRVTVRVTGQPSAPAALIREAVYFGLKRALTAEEGAQVRLLRAPGPAQPLRPGASLTFRLPLRVAGAGLLPVEAAPLITVVNRPLAAASAAALFYSNNPEQVRHGQSLFTGRLASSAPARLDYHHQNRTGRPLIFHVDALNTSDRPISLQLIAGVAEPELDTVQIGRRAGAAFLDSLDHGTGLVLSVPPHSRLPLVVQRFGPNLTVSGLLQVRQLSGPPGAASLQVLADEDREALAASPAHFALAVAETDSPRQVTAPAAFRSSGPGGAASPFIFGPPLVALSGAYAVGGKWEHLPLGTGESLHSADHSQRLWGNYGVSYYVTLALSNPTGAARTVGLYFAPEAGLAAGVFQIRGAPVLQFDPLSPPYEKELTRVRLAPGESRILRLRTILLNGSAYPASLTVHAL